MSDSKFAVRKILAITLGLAASFSLAQSPPPSKPPVIAVLVEPGFLAHGGIPSITPDQIPGLFEQCGLHAEALSVAQIENQKILTPARYPVLVLPYGNNYPASLLPALRDYHHAGGCLILDGVPLTRPMEKIGTQWAVAKNVPKVSGHDSTGLGTGDFTKPQFHGTLRVAHYGFVANTLGLDDIATPVPTIAFKLPASLNVATLDPKDEVIPLVESIDDQTKKTAIVTALIRHRCDLFNGAIDLWIGEVASKISETDAYFAKQLLVRGAAWCLKEKGLIDAADLNAAFHSVAKLGSPSPNPSGLAYHPAPHPWGDTFLPHSAPPARRLAVVNLHGLKPDEASALISLQALTSRTQPSIWLKHSHNDKFWLDDLVQKHAIDGYDEVTDWASLFQKFSTSFKGAVIPDLQLYRGETLAANVAACEDLIVTSPELAAKLHIPVRIDLRGKYKTYADGLQDIWNTYKAKFSPFLSEISAGLTGGSAYPMQWRGLIFWVAGPVDSKLPGADMLREQHVVANILSQMAPNSVMMGFPYGGEGVGLGEGGGVGLASSYAISLVCSDHLGNTCVTSGVSIPPLKQTPQAPPPPLQKDKIYIALVMSDGDNQQVWTEMFKSYFDHPRHGEFPLAFGIGPAMLDLQPTVTQWFYAKAGPTTEFIGDVSGIGYIQPAVYAKNYRDTQAVFDGFLDWTDKYQKRLDLKTLRTVEGEDDLLTQYAARVGGMHSIFADMGRYNGHDGIDELTYSLPGGLPIFRSVTSWRHGQDGFIPEIKDQVGTKRPAFVNAFVHCWTFNSMDAVARIYDSRDPDMVFVTPAQLAYLYQEAKTRGWAK